MKSWWNVAIIKPNKNMQKKIYFMKMSVTIVLSALDVWSLFLHILPDFNLNRTENVA